MEALEENTSLLSSLPLEIREKIHELSIETKESEKGKITQDILMLVRRLPPELREKIIKYKIETKVNEKRKMGFAAVHEAIKAAPYCEKCEQSAWIVSCIYCNNHSGCCSLCYKKEEIHYITDCGVVNGKEMFKRDMVCPICVFTTTESDPEYVDKIMEMYDEEFLANEV